MDQRERLGPWQMMEMFRGEEDSWTDEDGKGDDRDANSDDWRDDEQDDAAGLGGSHCLAESQRRRVRWAATPQIQVVEHDGDEEEKGHKSSLEVSGGESDQVVGGPGGSDQ